MLFCVGGGLCYGLWRFLKSNWWLGTVWVKYFLFLSSWGLLTGQVRLRLRKIFRCPFPEKYCCALCAPRKSKFRCNADFHTSLYCTFGRLMSFVKRSSPFQRRRSSSRSESPNALKIFKVIYLFVPCFFSYDLLPLTQTDGFTTNEN